MKARTEARPTSRREPERIREKGAGRAPAPSSRPRVLRPLTSAAPRCPHRLPQSSLLRMEDREAASPAWSRLAGVSLHLRGGGCWRWGERGGQSTLMKILGGAYQPDEGQIYVDDQPVAFASVKDSKRRHRPDPPGADARPQPRHRVEHLPRQRAAVLGRAEARPRLDARPRRRTARPGRHVARADHAGVDPHRRPDADGGDRQGGLSTNARSHHHGRADVVADVGRERTPVPDHPPAPRPTASASSPSPTAWRC